MSTPYSPQHRWMEWLVDMQVASCGCGSPVCLHTSRLGTATFPSTIFPSQHVCSDWLGRLWHQTVFNDDDFTAISHQNQHFEVISNNIPYTVILATISMAPPWPIIKRAEYLQYTLQHSCTTEIFTKRWSLVDTCIQTLNLSSLWPSTNISHSSVWWQQRSSSANESELRCSNKHRHILQTSSWSITACKIIQLIQSGLTLPPDCLLSHMLACMSIIMVFTTIIVTQSMQYKLSVPHVTKQNLPEKPTGKPTKTNFYRTRRKVRQKKKNVTNPLCHHCR